MSDISMEHPEPPQAEPDPGSGLDAPGEVTAPESTTHVLSDGALFPPVTPDPPPPPGYVDPIPETAGTEPVVAADPDGLPD